MMKTYDLYGVRLSDLDLAKAVVEKLLGLTFSAHESGYHCGDYYRFRDVGSEHFILQRNYDDVEGEWTEPEHSDMGILLYVNETTSAHQIAAKLATDKRIELLRHQEL